MAERRSPLSPAEPGFPSTPCQRRESRHPRRAPAHQQRQRLPRPSEAVAQPLQRRRHQEPAQLSRLAARSRSLGRQTRTAKLDQRRYRQRPIPTDTAIRASILALIAFAVGLSLAVMAGLVPAIHAGNASKTGPTWGGRKQSFVGTKLSPLPRSRTFDAPNHVDSRDKLGHDALKLVRKSPHDPDFDDQQQTL